MEKVEVVRILPRINRKQKSSTDVKSYAPFLSTVEKSPKLKKVASPSPAYSPGEERSVDRHNNSMVSYSPEKEGSSPFKDCSTRFRQKQSSSPGPGAYFQQQRQEVNREVKRGSPNALQYYRVKFPEMYMHHKSVSIQSYTKLRKSEKAGSEHVEKYLKGAVWSRYREDRFKWKNEGDAPGPGYYNISKQVQRAVKAAQSPEFSSVSARSFMDSIIYDSNLESKKVIPHHLYKKDEPGPGSYDTSNQYCISKPLATYEDRDSLSRRKKPKLTNLSNLLWRSQQHQTAVEPMLYIQEIHPEERTKNHEIHPLTDD